METFCDSETAKKTSLISDQLEEILKASSLSYFIQINIGLSKKLQDEYLIEEKKINGYFYYSKNRARSFWQSEFDYQMPLKHFPANEAINADPYLTEVYAKRRALLSMLKICAKIDPKLFLSNEKLLTILSEQPWKEGSGFLSAVAIEPCFLQTRTGSKLLRKFSFWNPNHARLLGKALHYIDDYQVDDLGGGKWILTVTLALMVLLSFIPEMPRLKDEDIFEILKKRGYAKGAPSDAGASDNGGYGAVRNKVFSKRTEITWGNSP